MIPDLRRKLISILRADEGCTDAQLLEAARARMKAHDIYRDLHKQRPAHTVTWDEVQLGQMVVAEHGPDAGLAVWMVSGRARDELGDDLRLLFVRIIAPTEDPEILWLDKRRSDLVTVLDLPGVGDGTKALGALKPQ